MDECICGSTGVRTTAPNVTYIVALIVMSGYSVRLQTTQCGRPERLAIIQAILNEVWSGAYHLRWCNVCSILKALTRGTSLQSFEMMIRLQMSHRFEEKQKHLGLIVSNIQGLEELYHTSDLGVSGLDFLDRNIALLQGFELNTSLMDWCEKGSSCDKSIDLYTLRN